MTTPTTPIVVHLDRARNVKWTNRARARNGSLPRPATFTDLAKPHKRMYALCALVWSALVEREHQFESPEDLADYFATEDQQVAALNAIGKMVEEAFPSKNDSGASDSSTSGQDSSSKSGAPSTTSS